MMGGFAFWLTDVNSLSTSVKHIGTANKWIPLVKLQVASGAAILAEGNCCKQVTGAESTHQSSADVHKDLPS